MLKALFRKQLMEINTWLFQDRKTGKRRSKEGMIGYIALYVLVFCSLGMIFYGMGTSLCEPLHAMDLDWMYFSIMGLISILLGVFGSVFTTYSTLYKAKDNEFLLSMPIQPSKILTVRLFGVWMWGFIYTAIVFVPALVVFWSTVSCSVLSVVFGILLTFFLSVFVLTLACILGWCVAKISVKLKNKSFVTVFAAIVFLVGYYYFYFKASEVLQTVLMNAQAMGEKVKGAARPLYWLGNAAEGNALSMLLFTALIAVLFALVYWVLSRSFLKMATTGSSTAKKKYREGKVRQKSSSGALFSRELRHFLSSSVYMLNCALGTLFLVAAGIVALIKAGSISELTAVLEGAKEFIVPIACAAICILTSMNDISAPSVSLEGKNLWLVQSLPVSPFQVLLAKFRLHSTVVLIPTLFCSACVMLALKADLLSALFLLLLPTVFVLFSAAFGLFVNLKFPNLKWTNEVIPIKQGISVVLAMFGEMLLVLALGGVYFAVKSFVGITLYLFLCTVLIAGLFVLLLFWLKKKGSEIFASLA